MTDRESIGKIEKHYYFADPSFSQLMKRRINKVLLLCSNYDAFMLDEDGRIDEQIFNEYVSLNLRYPPQFIHVSSSEEAFQILDDDQVDLIINMLSVEDMDPIELSTKIKYEYPQIPIVVLTPFSREVSIKLDSADMSAIDYVFCWLGNADLLLAIIKLVEDKMNVENDVENVGVQVIILVEDSIRFYSSYLPNIYKIIFKQSEEFMQEGLNEHQKMLRMRGRPKILMATTYEQGLELYLKYRHNTLGIISDIAYSRNGKIDKTAGIKLARKIKEYDKLMPVLLQSSDVNNEKTAKENLHVGFIDKNSKTISLELRSFIIKYFAFGDFIFQNPETLKEIDRATDLQNLQQKLFQISDESLEYHINRNHISKWLNARALFSIAKLFKNLTTQDFNDLDEVRRFLFDTIASFRRSKGRGVIAEFYRERFDEYLIFTRIGNGSIGGKARGLAFVDSLLKEHNFMERYPGVIITIPRTVVLTTDVFDEFMEENDLYDIALSTESDDVILNKFIQGRLPFRIHEDLLTFIRVVQNPIAVRSSSLLEDSHYQPFAGIYSTYMIPKVKNNDRVMIEMLSQAIKSVYASVFYKDSKSYMEATSNVIDEEKMAIVLQEVVGHQHNKRFYPTISGVARSLNFYPIAPESSEDGIANIALGLGKYIVDGGVNLRFSPRHPGRIIQLSSPEVALKDTQKEFFALDLQESSFTPSTNDGVNLLKLPITEGGEDGVLKKISSVYDFENNMLRDGTFLKGRRVLTFSGVLKHNKFPLAKILADILDIGARAMSNPIEIEFAVCLDNPGNKPDVFSFLQIRPIVEHCETNITTIGELKKDQTIIYSERALGNGRIENIFDVVYVKPEVFDPAKTEEIATRIGELNESFIKSKKNYVLIGPGRWGSADPWLGIPVKWTQISAARVIVESGLKDFRIDPSQGTHFFQNLTSFQVGYFTINPFSDDGYYDVEFLNKQETVFENNFIRHVRFKKQVLVKIDGKTNRGIIFKP